ADRGHRDGTAIAHLADDRRPDMDSDADAQWLIELVTQRAVQLTQPLGHQPGGVERRTASGSGIALDPEQRHDTVADEFVDTSPRRFDGVSHRREIAVEDEYHVIGKATLGETGEPADIGEQNGDFALAALSR